MRGRVRAKAKVGSSPLSLPSPARGEDLRIPYRSSISSNPSRGRAEYRFLKGVVCPGAEDGKLSHPA